MQSYQNAVITKIGGQLVPITNSLISVFRAGTRNLVPIFSDNTRTSLLNPMPSDAAGNYTFFAASGRYDVEINAPGYSPSNFFDILLNDPLEHPTAVIPGNTSVTVDAAVARDFFITVTNNAMTVLNPVNTTDGTSLRIFLQQDAAGNHPVVLDTKYKTQNNLPIKFSTQPGAIDLLEVRYVQYVDKFFVTPILNFNAPAPAQAAAAPNPGTVTPNPSTSPTAQPPAYVYPTPRNNRVMFLGDSRLAGSTGPTVPKPDITTSWGVADWMLRACNYRARFTDQYAINGETLSTISSRMITPGTQGNVLSCTAGICVFLGGVNDAASDISVTGPKYRYIIEGLLNAGFVVVLLNELPNGNYSGAGPAGLARRAFLDNFVPTDATKTPNLIKLNSYDLLAQSPTSYDWITGYHETADTIPLHPNQRANSALGTLIGNKLAPMLAQAGWPARNNTMPALDGAEAGFFVSDQFNGVAGTLGTGATGVMATNWVGDPVPTGLTVVYSKGTDPDGFQQQIVTISGTGTVPSASTTGGWYFELLCAQNSVYGASGDLALGMSRVMLNAGSAGISGIGVKLYAQDYTNGVYTSATAFDAHGFSSDTYTGRIGAGYPGAAFDDTIITPEVILGTGWTASASKAFKISVGISGIVGTPITAVIKFSRAGVQQVNNATPTAITNLRAFPRRTVYATGVLRPNHLTQTQLDDALRARYTAMTDPTQVPMYVSACGGMVCNLNLVYQTDGSQLYQAFSEGQGYAMLIAVIMAGYDTAAKTRFDALYKFCQAYPAYGMPTNQADLMEWRINTNCAGSGSGLSSPNGDLDIAMALLMADKQWGSAGTVNYLAQALLRIAAIKVVYFASGAKYYPKGSNLLSAFRCSDATLAHFKSFGTATGDAFWTTVVGYIQDRLIYANGVYAPGSGLQPDWLINMDTATPRPSIGFEAANYGDEGKYSWSACRMPLRIAQDAAISGDVKSMNLLSRAAPFWRGVVAPAGQATLVSNIRAGYQLDGTQINDYTIPAFSGPAMATQMAVVNTTSDIGGNQVMLNSFWDYHAGNFWPGYYDMELQFLTMLVVAGNWWIP